MRATYSPSTFGMHHISLRHGLRPFSANRRRTVSPDRLSWSVSLTIAPAKSSSVQRARPSGGLAQAVAPNRPSSLPVSLRSPPVRRPSLSRRSQPQRSRLHRKARPVPRFHLPLRAHVPPPARRGRHAAPLSGQPALGPPDDRDARTKRPHSPSTWRRPKHSNPHGSERIAHPRLARN